MVNGTPDQAMASTDGAAKECSLLRLHMRPERIHFLKFILEGYDGLAVLTTVDASQGLVEIRYPIEVADDLKNLLNHIHSQIVKNTA
jgi:hypothetical protein